MNQSDLTSALKTPNCIIRFQSVTQMERRRNNIITLVCVLLFKHQRIFGTEVNISVKPGDNVTLFCDCVIPVGFTPVWMRNCSHEFQPSLLINAENIFKISFPRFSFLYNKSSNSFDLRIENVSVYDEGTYYCAKAEKKIGGDVSVMTVKLEYQYGNSTTHLSVLEPVSGCIEPPSTVSPPHVWECFLCWMLLVSVCAVCVLLCSICVYCLYLRRTTVSGADCDERIETQTFNRHDEAGDDCEVCYASLDMPTKRQKQLKRKRTQSSDFSIYSDVGSKRT